MCDNTPQVASAETRANGVGAGEQTELSHPPASLYVPPPPQSPVPRACMSNRSLPSSSAHAAIDGLRAGSCSLRSPRILGWHKMVRMPPRSESPPLPPLAQDRFWAWCAELAGPSGLAKSRHRDWRQEDWRHFGCMLCAPASSNDGAHWFALVGQVERRAAPSAREGQCVRASDI